MVTLIDNNLKFFNVFGCYFLKKTVVFLFENKSIHFYGKACQP